MLGDQTRLQIVEHLLDGEKNVSELVQLLEMSQSRISNHLACLRWCGLTRTRRAGRQVYYALADERIARLIELSRELLTQNAEYVLACTRI